MTQLVWGAPGTRLYSAGVKRGVIYPSSGRGVVWNGLTAVKETPSDVTLRQTYYDGKKIQGQTTVGGFSAMVEAFTYPDELEDEGLFGFSYVTGLGNDVDGNDHGYQIHLVYNALAIIQDQDYSTLDDQADAQPFNWLLATLPEYIPDVSPTSHLIVDTRSANPWVVTMFEEMLYGSSTVEPHLPSAVDVLDLFENTSIVKVTDNGDGTFDVEGPDEIVYMSGDDEFTVDWPSAVYIDPVTYTLSSL